MTNINTSVISDKLAHLSTGDLAQILLDNSDVELGKLVVPPDTDNQGDELLAEAAKQLWTAWGAAYRKLGNTKLAEVMNDHEGEDLEGMYVIIPSSEQDGLYCCGDGFEVKHLSGNTYAARYNGQAEDYDWAIYKDVEDLQAEYIGCLENAQMRARDRSEDHGPLQAEYDP